MTVALTLFTTCKPFQHQFTTIQRNALRSWKRLCPPCEVLVFGDEVGVRQCCEELGFKHIPEVMRSNLGTPLLNDLFRQADHNSSHDHLAYVNADIMLTHDLITAVETTAGRFQKFLLIARRWNVEVDSEWDFERADWEVALRSYAARHGTLEPPYGGVDLFVYPRGMWDALPPFAVGRTRWDSALIYQALRLRIPVIDATEVLTSIHQNHDYSHIAHGTEGVFKGSEAIGNENLLGGEEFILTPLNATHVMTQSGIRPNNVFYPPYLLRRLAALPALYRPLRPLAPLVRYLAPWWRRLRKVPENKLGPKEKTYSKPEPFSPYPISINAEPLYPSAIPPGGGVENFDTPEALALNRARMEHLDSLHLNLQGKRVLDVGCGVGHLAQFFVKEGCDVLCLDARKENVDRLKILYPRLQAKVFNIETDSLSQLGSFNVVLAFGVLYHLENPFRALRNLATISTDFLLIETMVADHSLPLVVMSEETSAYTQALHNIGSRPTPSFIVLALRSTRFEYIYAPRIAPNHPDFAFAWKNDLSHSRDGHLLRCMFIASRYPLDNPNLVSLLKHA